MDLINSVCESPLGLYVFGNDFQSVDWLIDRTSSGSAMANEALYQFFNWNVGFGGVRGSGNGKYHGKWGFDEFSHCFTICI